MCSAVCLAASKDAATITALGCVDDHHFSASDFIHGGESDGRVVVM